jgi:hypothetical protein
MTVMLESEDVIGPQVPSPLFGVDSRNWENSRTASPLPPHSGSTASLTASPRLDFGVSPN